MSCEGDISPALILLDSIRRTDFVIIFSLLEVLALALLRTLWPAIDRRGDVGGW
jgi:hypothetical protein